MAQSWRPKEAGDVPNGLILFDGVCVLCSGLVQFVLRHDRDGWFRFTPIQSPYGRTLAQRLGISTEAPESNAVIVRGRAHFKSDSAFQVSQRLPSGAWSRLFLLVPRPVRDFFYDRVAHNRYRLLGRTESCMVPTPERMARFVFDDGAADAAFSSRPSPFGVLLGDDLARLPAMVRRVHTLTHSLQMTGRAEVAAAPGLLARLLCRVAGLPPAGRDIPVTVGFHPDGPLREFWDRRFGGRRYASTIRAGDPRAPNMLVEHFGPFDLEFRLTLRGAGESSSLGWSVAGWRLFGVRLPHWSVPRIECIERAQGDRYTFDIDVTFPLAGHVIRYAGWLEEGRSIGGVKAAAAELAAAQ